MNRITVPGLLDLLTVDDAPTIAAIAADRRFDRKFIRRGPLLNRVILDRIRSILTLGGVPLPAVAEHGPARPLATQTDTRQRLEALAATGMSGPEMDALVAYVRGAGAASDGGILVQQLVGKLFDPAYSADRESWSAAEVLRDAPTSFNPVSRLVWMLTGRIGKSRALLAAKVHQDPTGLHATGVAIHNLVESLVRLRALHADPVERRQRSVAAAVAAAMVAPRQVLRQPVESGTCPAGGFTPDTLVLLRLGKADAGMPGHATAFMSESWSACPAENWVPALVAAIWRRATGGTAP